MKDSSGIAFSHLHSGRAVVDVPAETLLVAMESRLLADGVVVSRHRRDATARHGHVGESYGWEIISDPGVIRIKVRAPGGTIAEFVPLRRYKPGHS